MPDMTFVCPWRHVALILSGRRTMIKTAEVRNITNGRRWNEKCWTGFLRNWQSLSFSINFPPLWNPKIRYGFYNRELLVPTVGKINMVRPVSFYCCNIPFNIIPPSTISPFKCSVPLTFLKKFGMSFLPVICMLLTFQIHHPWFDYPTNMPFMELLTLRFLPSFCYCLPFSSEYSPRRFFSQTPSDCI